MEKITLEAAPPTVQRVGQSTAAPVKLNGRECFLLNKGRGVWWHHCFTDYTHTHIWWRWWEKNLILILKIKSKILSIISVFRGQVTCQCLSAPQLRLKFCHGSFILFAADRVFRVRSSRWRHFTVFIITGRVSRLLCVCHYGAADHCCCVWKHNFPDH